MDPENNEPKKSGFRSKLRRLKFNYNPNNSEKPNEIDDKIESPGPEIQAQSEPEKDPIVESLLESSKEQQFSSNSSFNFEEFIDERELVSHDTLGKKEMKIKVMEVSDEIAPSQWKFGDRVKVNKILVTIKHLESQQVEEGEFDIASIEKELIEKRHYTSTNRWVPTNDIKNGYVVNSRHTTLISDAAALEYVVF